MADRLLSPTETFLTVTGPLVVINLAQRTDRRAEFAVQLRRLGLSYQHPMVQVFDAIRPMAAEGFPSVGCRGCFLSHLGVLRRALKNGWESVLICEDDLDFTADAFARLPAIATALEANDWAIFYGGYGNQPPGPEVAPGLVRADPDRGIRCSHFYVVRGAAMADLVRYLEAMLNRPAGHADGGLMHYDGALGWFRKAHPQQVTLAAIPAIGVQRPSRTDIHALRWFDRWPGARTLATLARRARAERRWNPKA